MLLLTFFPEMEKVLFASPEKDPIFKNLPLRGRSRDKVVSSWLFDGAHVKDLHSVLQKASAEWRVEFATKDKSAVSFRFISDLIEHVGTPVVLGYQSGGLGDHAVLVEGVRVDYPGTKKEIRWLLLADPAGDERLHWDQLVGLGEGRLELLWVEKREGLRPDVVVTERDDDGRLINLRRWRYWRVQGKWAWWRVEELLQETSGPT